MHSKISDLQQSRRYRSHGELEKMRPLHYTVNAAEALGGVFQCFSIVGCGCGRRHRKGDQASGDGTPRQSGGPGSYPAACGTSADCFTPGDQQFGCHRKSRAIIYKQEHQGIVRIPDRLLSTSEFLAERAHPVTSREAMPRFSGLPQSGIHKLHHRFHRQGGSYGRWNDPRNLICGKYGTPLEVVRS